MSGPAVQSQRNRGGLRRITEGVFAVRSVTPLQAQRVARAADGAHAWEAARVVDAEAADFHGHVDQSSRSASVWPAPSHVAALAPLYRALRHRLVPLVQREWDVPLGRYETIQVVRYHAGQGYAPHQDVRSSLDDRLFTVLWTLNVGYGGGSTRFPRLGVSWRGAPGDALVFPADYLHEAERVDRGAKYVAVSWLLTRFPMSALVHPS